MSLLIVGMGAFLLMIRGGDYFVMRWGALTRGRGYKRGYLGGCMGRRYD